MLATGLWSHDDGADPAASTSATGNDTVPSASPRTPGPAQLPTAPAVTRLRNAASDLCLDIRGTVKEGAGTELAACSTDVTQQWSYEADGLLRSEANPELCLDSHVDAGVVILGECAEDKAKRAQDVRYDLTVQGELIPRWDEQLALAATTGEAGADIVVKVRDGSKEQRWLTDPSSVASPGSLSVTGSGAPQARPATLRNRV